MSKATLLVLSPFSYVFQRKKYYAAGDRIVLDTKKADKSAELNYLLTSVNNAFFTIDEFNTSSELYSKLIATKDNQNNIVNSEIYNQQETVLRDRAYVPPEELPSYDKDLESTKNVEIVDRVEPVEEKAETPTHEKIYSFAELDDLHWTKVRKIVEAVGIEYDNIDQAIEDYLSATNQETKAV